MRKHLALTPPLSMVEGKQRIQLLRQPWVQTEGGSSERGSVENGDLGDHYVEMRVELRRTEGGRPFLYTVVMVLVVVMPLMRRFCTRLFTSLAKI